MMLPGAGQAVDGALAGGFVAFLDADVAAEFAGGNHAAVLEAGQVAGHEKQVTDADGRHEVADGRVRLGYGETNAGQLVFYFHVVETPGVNYVRGSIGRGGFQTRPYGPGGYWGVRELRGFSGSSCHLAGLWMM